MPKLTGIQIQAQLTEVKSAFPHDLCLTCECFLGYVAKLRLEADDDGKELLAAYKVARAEIHPCLGCDPCPPGDLYAANMREKRKNTLITL